MSYSGRCSLPSPNVANGSLIQLYLLLFLLSFSIRDASHHGEELIKVNLSIAVFIDLRNRLIKLLLSVHVSELIAGQELQKLARVDLAAAV